VGALLVVVAQVVSEISRQVMELGHEASGEWAALGFVESRFWISGHCRGLVPNLKLDWGKHAEC